MCVFECVKGAFLFDLCTLRVYFCCLAPPLGGRFPAHGLNAVRALATATRPPPSAPRVYCSTPRLRIGLESLPIGDARSPRLMRGRITHVPPALRHPPAATGSTGNTRAGVCRHHAAHRDERWGTTCVRAAWGRTTLTSAEKAPHRGNREQQAMAPVADRPAPHPYIHNIGEPAVWRARSWGMQGPVSQVRRLRRPADEA